MVQQESPEFQYHCLFSHGGKPDSMSACSQCVFGWGGVPNVKIKKRSRADCCIDISTCLVWMQGSVGFLCNLQVEWKQNKKNVHVYPALSTIDPKMRFSDIWWLQSTVEEKNMSCLEKSNSSFYFFTKQLK